MTQTTGCSCQIKFSPVPRHGVMSRWSCCSALHWNSCIPLGGKVGGGLFNLHICSLRLRICNVRNLRLSLCTKGSTGKFKCYVTDVKSTVPSPPHPPVSYLVLRPTIMRGLIENSLTPPKNKPSTHATKCA